MNIFQSSYQIILIKKKTLEFYMHTNIINQKGTINCQLSLYQTILEEQLTKGAALDRLVKEENKSLVVKANHSLIVYVSNPQHF